MKKLLFILMFCFVTVAANAELITIAIEAEVNFIEDDGNLLNGNFIQGQILSGQYTYDSATPDNRPASDIDGDYRYSTSPYGISVSSPSGYTFKTDPENVSFKITIANNDSAMSGDFYSVRSYQNLSLPDSIFVDSITCMFLADNYNVLPNDNLPTTALNLDDWDTRNLRIFGGTKDVNQRWADTFEIEASIISTQIIPEPITILLVSSGIFFVRKKY